MVNVESQVLYVWSRAVNERRGFTQAHGPCACVSKSSRVVPPGIFTPISLIRN